jgi:hypothetical protein
MTLLQCLVCGDLVALQEGPGSCRCLCGRAFAVLNGGVLELGGTGRAVWLDPSGVLWDPADPGAPPNLSPKVRRRGATPPVITNALQSPQPA